MASKENCQTHKQFSARKKRLTLKREFDNKKQLKMNEITDIDEQIDKLKSLKEQKQNELNEIDEEAYQKFANIYNDKELLSEMFNLGTSTTYSLNIINDLEITCKNGINDDIKNVSNIIDQLYDIDNRINEEVKHTNCAGDLLDRFGSMISLPTKGDDDNGD